MPFWLAYSSESLDTLKTLRVDGIAYEGGEILLLSKSGDGTAADLPEVGTEAFDALNRRRAELVDKDVSAKLEGREREEPPRT